MWEELTPICGALATAPQNVVCFAFDIRHCTATFTMFYICGFAAGEVIRGLGRSPSFKKLCVSVPLCEKICCGTVTRLVEAKQWSGTAERSETAEGRENPNHRSLNKWDGRV